MNLSQWLRPMHPESRKVMSQREWLLLIIFPRTISPLCVAGLLYTTHWQVQYILWREDVWMNVAVFLTGFGAIVLNLKTMYDSWRLWTWHGELNKRMWPVHIFSEGLEGEMGRKIIGQHFDAKMLAKLDIKNHEGYMGAFTRREVLGAWRNGTVVVKSDSEPNDATPLGTEGVILGSIFGKDISPHVMYFVEWNDKPKFAVSVIGWKIKPKGM